MSYDDLIVTRPFRRAAMVSKKMLDEGIVGGSLGPVKFAVTLATGQLLDEIRNLGLRAHTEVETAYIEQDDGSIKIGVEILADGLLPDERL